MSGRRITSVTTRWTNSETTNETTTISGRGTTTITALESPTKPLNIPVSVQLDGPRQKQLKNVWKNEFACLGQLFYDQCRKIFTAMVAVSLDRHYGQNFLD
jgi:hypothetical protein